MSGVYGFWQGPAYRASTREELFSAALDQPMSLGSTFWDQAKGGVLESFGLGTVTREMSLPPAAPGRWYGDTDKSYAERRKDYKTITEDEYKASPYFRDNVPWDDGMTEDRAAALAAMYDAKRVREYFAEKRPITAFFGNLAGQAVDPVNYIPVAGPSVRAAAVARMGLVKGVAATAALDAAANTAIAGLATRETRQGFGDDVSWQAMISEIATAALIGSAFGTVGGVLERRAGIRADALRRDAEVKVQTLKATQEARIALNEAIGGLANDGEVRLSPNGVAPVERIAREVTAISEAYDTVRAQPSGPVNDPLVEIRPDDIEGTILARGAFKNVNEVDVSSKRGFGLVKILWRHGEESSQAPEFQVGKGDITALPEIVRGFEPSSVSNDGRLREWRVERDGRTIVYADSLTPQGRHVVTAYVQRPDAPGAEVPLSRVRKPVASGSPDEPLKPVGDTASEALPSPERGQSLPASGNVARSAIVDNSPARPEPPPAGRAEAEAKVAKPENYKALADQYRVDPETGTFPEEAELRQLAQEGWLSEEDMAVLDDADAAYQDGASYGEALKSVVGCLL